MRKLIAAINMTLDGFCDHTAGIADEELHDHYTALLREAGDILYGRTTYQLMESFWPTLVKNPSGEKSMDDFALAIENVPKTVFSRTLTNVGWKNVRLAKGTIKEEVSELRKKQGKDIFVGSRSLIVQCMELGLIDEYQICVHPVVAGGTLPLFKSNERLVLKLLKTKTFGSGAIVLYYEPAKR